MHHVLILGAGKIGSLIAALLDHSKDYQLFLADINIHAPHLKRITSNTNHLSLVELDANDEKQVVAFLQKNSIKTIVSSLPFYCNIAVAKIAKEFNLNYFDLTEDRHTTATITEFSKQVNSAFVPQSGLAPGFISIVANHLMEHFAELDTVKMRVGALPLNISNALQYTLTWSTDGIINEYGNLCEGVSNGEEVTLLPLDDLEEIKIDGLTYEAFNTSGGIGSLTTTFKNRVKNLSYKTIRYPGHCEKMRFLMNDLNLNNDRDTLKRILENCIPKSGQDVVLVYVSVTGSQDNLFTEENYVKKFYQKNLFGLNWSAIQLTTASELCAILDIVLAEPDKYRGLIKHEQFSLETLTHNRFGKFFA